MLVIAFKINVKIKEKEEEEKNKNNDVTRRNRNVTNVTKNLRIRNTFFFGQMTHILHTSTVHKTASLADEAS